MARERIIDQPAFLLHSVPWSETSLVLDLLTRDHGRIAAVAKGARRPRSALRAVLLQFQPLTVGWTGRSDLHTLVAAEWQGGLEAPRGYRLMCAFYLNELLMRLMARDDAHPAVFDGYRQALGEMSRGLPLDDVLRRFEWLLLRETGWAPDTVRDAADRPIDASLNYAWMPAEGFFVSEPGDHTVQGDTLLSIADQQYHSEHVRLQARQLTRRILNHHLEGQALSTRRILQDLQR